MKNDIANRLELYFDRLWPIHRSIMGAGFRESLNILEELIPVNRLSFKTGQKVFDWTVPNEWIIRDAYFIDPDGKKHANYKTNNLHIVSYSIPFQGTMNLDELSRHIYTLPDIPDAIPYITSYYKENWGFCISHNELKSLPDGEYKIYIDSELMPGTLEIGEAFLPGESKKEILFSTYLCHPSLANNELSGPLALAFLYEKIKNMESRHFSYRFVISAETIGTISYLSIRGKHLKDYLVAGYIMTCLGDKGNFTYKLSRQENTLADKAAQVVLANNEEHSVLTFDPSNGSDERQYCSPGFNLPVGSLMRTMYGEYPEYHTSLDNKSKINFFALSHSVDIYYLIVEALENNFFYTINMEYCEPQLIKYELYPKIGTAKLLEGETAAIAWLLNYSDGEHDLFDISLKSNIDVQLLYKSAEILCKKKLLQKIYY